MSGPVDQATGKDGAGRRAVKKDDGALSLSQVLALTLGYWRPHLRVGVLLLAILAVPQLYKTFFAYSQRWIVDRGLLGHDAGVLVGVLTALAAGFLVAAAAQLVADYLAARVNAAIVNGIRLELFQHLQRLSIGYYARARAGDVVAHFTSDVTDIQKSLTKRVIEAVLAVLGLLINVPVAFSIEWRLAIVMLLAMPTLGIGSKLFGRRAGTSRYALKQEEAALASTVQESVRAQPVVKVFGLSGWLLGRFSAQLRELATRFVRAEFAAEMVGSASSLGVLAGQVAVIGAGAFLAFRGVITTGDLVAFISLHALVSKEAYDLTKKVVPSLISSSGALQRIEELLAIPEDVRTEAGAEPLPRLQSGLGLERVSFSYGDGRRALDSVSLAIRAGQRVALVGPSGSGKSTVLQLLLRFYDPQEGRVVADGRDLRQVTLESLHGQMAAVFQESFLFNGSIRENISLGKLGASDEEIERAARSAEIHELVESLPEGYDTQVGELGGRLSGGQRQRVAIARAILRDPAILLLDEATSALDPATEAAVNRTLERLAEGRTVVLVTHRLTSAQGADRIMVLDQGRLVEEGTHEQLLAGDGLYRKLWEKQSGIEVSGDGLEASIQPERLAAIPLFAALGPEHRADLAHRLVVERHEADRPVVAEGEPGDRLFVVARGKLAVTVAVGDSERKLGVLSDGDFFGEIALLTGGSRVASVRTLTPTVLLSLHRRDLEALLAQHPELRDLLDGAMLERFHQAADLLER